MKYKEGDVNTVSKINYADQKDIGVLNAQLVDIKNKLSAYDAIDE
ncbi:hypothetical protein N5E66_14090 [Acinetobacter johnsonii]|nr:hypothetical protein [Acinetobacter johnsonii]MDH1489254.1 hypothetical protein [Acinetobacter johnsonii]MDH1615186.1 hypothetical protein [Acinetobacter johnsonii]